MVNDEDNDVGRAVSEWVLKHRKRRGLTQAQLADAVGVSQPAIQVLEKHPKNPSYRLITALERFFGDTVTDPTDDWSAATRAWIQSPAGERLALTDEERWFLLRAPTPPNAEPVPEFFAAMVAALRLARTRQ